MRFDLRRYAFVSLLSLTLAASTVQAKKGSGAAQPAPKAKPLRLKPGQESPAVKAARKLGTTTKNPANKMADGLIYIDVKEGKGAAAKAGAAVEVHYTGWLPDGTKFDSSRDRGQPFTFPLGAGQVIKGWDKGVAGMKPGGIRKLIVPAGLGYGARAAGPIPPNSTLIFEVKFLTAL